MRSRNLVASYEIHLYVVLATNLLLIGWPPIKSIEPRDLLFVWILMDETSVNCNTTIFNTISQQPQY